MCSSLDSISGVNQGMLLDSLSATERTYIQLSSCRNGRRAALIAHCLKCKSPPGKIK